MMAWREVTVKTTLRDIAKACVDLPPADRIALARELLAGVGYHAAVIPDEWDIPGEFGEGWNACRAAMMGEE